MTDPSFWDKEPALIIGVVTAILALATAFGLGMTHDQQMAILGVVAAALALIGSVVVRSHGTSPATAAKLIAQIPSPKGPVAAPNATKPRSASGAPSSKPSAMSSSVRRWRPTNSWRHRPLWTADSQ